MRKKIDIFRIGSLENLDKSIWISNVNVVERTELLLDEPDIPINAVKPLEADFTSNQFIKFGPSDKKKDAAQVTVPFLDGTFIEGNPSILSGIGLYFRSQPHFGGFISLYTKSFDFGSLIEPIIIT